MAAQGLRTALVSEDDHAFLRRAFLPPALIYPLWHLAAPANAVDPWLVWWLVSSYLLSVGVLSLRFPAVDHHLLDAFNFGSALVSLQLYLLAFANDMHPFYSVGSVMSVLAALPFIRSVRNLLAYAAFIGLLSVVLYILDPDVRKVAYWGGTLPVLAAAYHRLSVQQAAARVAREHQDQLERRVEERTAELSRANQRLHKEMEERERLESELRFSQKLEAVGRLAGGVAHEFNNLLTTIAIYADLVLSGLPQDSPLCSDAQQIKKTSAQASTLTRQLLAFSRKKELGTQIIELTEVIEKTTKTLEHLLGSDIDLVLRNDGARHVIRANADQLDQVLINLALNARDAMPMGGTLGIETRLLPAGEQIGEGREADDFVLIAVSDTGIGMDAETCERAFDPFFTRKQVNQGTGLGLSLVYGVVTQAGGQVRLLSELGRGTRVEIYWPAAAGTATNSGEESTAPARRRGTERVLLVEDDAELRRSMERVLRSQGYQVVGAEDAEAALRQARRQEFDLLVSDVVMPRMSGLELIERLATVQPIPALLVSGNPDHSSLRNRAVPPDVVLLPKPFSVDELTSEVRIALETASRKYPREGQ